MSQAAPSIVVLAGPNGAGKSTAAPLILKEALGIAEFVNADVIARGLSGFEPERAALAAGRIMLARQRELARQRVGFAFETTLASRSFAPWLADLVRSGYEFHLVFLWLPSADLAVARVATRVQDGGHDVPEETIRRRYDAGLSNFFRLYQPMTTTWQLCDNSGPSGPRPIASGEAGFSRIDRGLTRTAWDADQGEVWFMNSDEPKDVRAIMLDGRLIHQALREAWARTLIQHKRMGTPIVVWRDGQVVWIPAEEIEIPGADGDLPHPSDHLMDSQGSRFTKLRNA